MKKMRCLYAMSTRRLVLWLTTVVATIAILVAKESDLAKMNEFTQCLIVFVCICIVAVGAKQIWFNIRAKDILINGIRTKVKADDICRYESFSSTYPRLFITGKVKNPENNEWYTVRVKTNLDYEKTLSVVCRSCAMRNYGKGCTNCSKENKFLKYHTLYFYLYYSPNENMVAIDQHNVSYTEQSNELYTNNYTYENFEI